MDFSLLFLLFIKGIFIGFVIAVPVGPVGILCIRRTLSHQNVGAALTGLGSAFADTFYAAVTAFSLAGIAAFITKYDFYLKLFGGLIVACISFSIIMNPSPKKTDKIEGRDSPFHVFTSAFVLTISNPITLIVFAAAFTAVGISPLHQSFSQASFLVAGVFLGASCWWLTLITISHLMQHKLSDPQLLWINRFSGVILFGFAAYILISLL
ncbi:MAG: LysE family transporter [Alphaproteobacteria bacterium]|nr:LysE family transporter [Alphaproteobacteria bacterium]